MHASCLELSDNSPCPLMFNEDRIRQAFFHVFTALLKNYKTCLIIPPNGLEEFNSTSDVFSQEKFLLEFSIEAKVF